MRTFHRTNTRKPGDRVTAQRQVDIYKPTIRVMNRPSLGITELYFSVHLLERTHKLTIPATDRQTIDSIKRDLFGDDGIPADKCLGVDFDEQGNIIRVYSDESVYDVIDDPLRPSMEWQGGA